MDAIYQIHGSSLPPPDAAANQSDVTVIGPEYEKPSLNRSCSLILESPLSQLLNLNIVCGKPKAARALELKASAKIKDNQYCRWAVTKEIPVPVTKCLTKRFIELSGIVVEQ